MMAPAVHVHGRSVALVAPAETGGGQEPAGAADRRVGGDPHLVASPARPVAMSGHE